MQTLRLNTPSKTTNGFEGKRYAIIQETIEVHTKKVLTTEQFCEVEIHCLEDFTEVSHNIAYENARAKEISKNLGFPTYTVKKLISL